MPTEDDTATKFCMVIKLDEWKILHFTTITEISLSQLLLLKMQCISCKQSRFISHHIDDIFHSQGQTVGSAPRYFPSTSSWVMVVVRISGSVNRVRVGWGMENSVCHVYLSIPDRKITPIFVLCHFKSPIPVFDLVHPLTYCQKCGFLLHSSNTHLSSLLLLRQLNCRSTSQTFALDKP